MKDKFCRDHQHLASQCLIKGCQQPAEAGHITCSEVSHRAKEDERKEQIRPAYFDLNRRLSKDNVPTHTPQRKSTSLLTQDTVNFTDFTDVDQGSRTVKGKEKKDKLQISRNWTHNEQLFVLSCGVIVARSTFFFSEGVVSVKASNICRQNLY